MSFPAPCLNQLVEGISAATFEISSVSDAFIDTAQFALGGAHLSSFFRINLESIEEFATQHTGRRYLSATVAMNMRLLQSDHAPASDINISIIVDYDIAFTMEQVASEGSDPIQTYDSIVTRFNTSVESGAFLVDFIAAAASKNVSIIPYYTTFIFSRPTIIATTNSPSAVPTFRPSTGAVYLFYLRSIILLRHLFLFCLF